MRDLEPAGQPDIFHSQGRIQSETLAVCSLIKKITAITVQKKNPDRVNIYLDGEFVWGGAYHSRVAQERRPAQRRKDRPPVHEDEREWAYQQSLLYLSYRARSEKEIRQNLRKHEVSVDVIEETLERLRKAGLANDNEFAQTWVENRSTFRPRSKQALSIELRQKELDNETIRGVSLQRG